jgi:hypothetical protein
MSKRSKFADAEVRSLVSDQAKGAMSHGRLQRLRASSCAAWMRFCSSAPLPIFCPLSVCQSHQEITKRIRNNTPIATLVDGQDNNDLPKRLLLLIAINEQTFEVANESANYQICFAELRRSRPPFFRSSLQGDVRIKYFDTPLPETYVLKQSG